MKRKKKLSYLLLSPGSQFLILYNSLTEKCYSLEQIWLTMMCRAAVVYSFAKKLAWDVFYLPEPFNYLLSFTEECSPLN